MANNKWIEHVKNYSKLHDMKYNEALKNQQCKDEYKKIKGSGLYASALPGKGKVADMVVNGAKNVKSKVKTYVKNKIKDKLNNVVNNTVDNVIGMGVVDKK